MTLDHSAAAGLTAASVVSAAGAMTGFFPIIAAIIAACAGLAAIVSYTFSTLDSPSFQRRMALWTMRRRMKKLMKLRKQQVVLAAKLQALDTLEQAHVIAKQMVTDAQNGVLVPPPGRAEAAAQPTDQENSGKR